MPTQITPELRDRAMADLHSAGWADTPIALILHSSRAAVRRWRDEHGLTANRDRRVKIDSAKAREMYDQGASDGEIARHFGVNPIAALLWRKRRGLPANWSPRCGLPDDLKRSCRKMLRLGATVPKTAATLGVNPNSVRNLRAGMTGPGLRPSGITDVTIRSRVLADGGIAKRIDRAIGASVPADVRSEAVGDLYVAVLDGRIDLQFIEKVAPSFRNRAFDLCGSRYGPRSLDEKDEDGLSLGDALADPDALEQMEAAAEYAYEMDDK